MGDWYWLLWLLLALGAIPALFGLHRLCLWLESRGWLYYRKNRPSGSSMGAFLALQQYIEPQVKYVLEAKNKPIKKADQEGVKERLMAQLLACLASSPVNCDVVRFHLAAAKSAGLDWRQLYEEAVRVQISIRPESAARIPVQEDVAPLG